MADDDIYQKKKRELSEHKNAYGDSVLSGSIYVPPPPPKKKKREK